MTTHDRIYARVLRRETHSSRAAPAITLAILLILVFAYIATEAVLAFFGQPALLVAPADALAATLAAPDVLSTAVLVAAGALVAVAGLALLIVSLSPGRRAVHVAPTARTAVVIDNRAVASALARRAARAAGVDADQVVVAVGHRTAEVRVQPTSGWPVDEAAVTSAVEDEIERMDLSPTLRPSVKVATTGVVGA